MEKLHMQYDVISNLYFYDFQNIMDTYNDILKEREEQDDDNNDYVKNQENMMKRAQQSMPKYTPPKFNIPKI